MRNILSSLATRKHLLNLRIKDKKTGEVREFIPGNVTSIDKVYIMKLCLDIWEKGECRKAIDYCERYGISHTTFFQFKAQVSIYGLEAVFSHIIKKITDKKKIATETD